MTIGTEICSVTSHELHYSAEFCFIPTKNFKVASKVISSTSNFPGGPCPQTPSVAAGLQPQDFGHTTLK